MNKLIFWKKGRQFEVKIMDISSGDFIIIDNDFMNENPLTEEEYLKIPKVVEILEAEDVTKYSLQ